MYIILPRSSDANSLLTSMTSEYFNKMQSDSIYSYGKLLLPRFSIEYDVDGLKDALISMGVPFFAENTDTLSLVEENIPVWLSDIIQKVAIKVDEKGTNDPVETRRMMTEEPSNTSAETFEMICNKPFVFVLYDFGQILFTGIVNNP